MTLLKAFHNPLNSKMLEYLYTQGIQLSGENILAFVLIYVLGLSIMRLVGTSFSIKELLGFSSLLGFGGTTILLFVFLITFPDKLNVKNFTFFSLAFSTIIFSLSLLKHPIAEKHFNKESRLRLARKLRTSFKVNIVFLMALLLIFYIGFGLLLKAIYWPVTDWDAITTFDFFARSIVHEKTLTSSVIMGKNLNTGVAYPPLVSLGLSYAYLFDFSNPKFIFPCVYLSFLLSFYCLTKRVTNDTAAIFFTFLIIVTPEISAFSTFVKTNVIQTAYSSSGIIALFVWRKTRQMNFLYLAAILLGLNGWTRSEGVEFIGISILILCYYLKTKRLSWLQLIYFSLICLLPFLTWQVYLSVTPEIAEYAAVNIIKTPFWEHEKASLILNAHIGFFMHLQYFGYIFKLLLVSSGLQILFARSKKQEYFHIAVLVILIFTHIILLYQLEYPSVGNMKFLLNHSLKRYIFNWIPISSFVIATSISFTWLFNKIERFTMN